MTHYLERTDIARALKARTWQSGPGGTGCDDSPSGYQYPVFYRRYAAGAAQTPATGSTHTP
ncbi:MAG: hypothetical protein V3R85_02875 [Alphaproteobacteria bacterium]